MQTRFPQIRPLACCSLLSVLAHLLLVSSLRMLGSYDFSAPVNQPRVVMVDLAAAASLAPLPAAPPVRQPGQPSPRPLSHAAQADSAPMAAPAPPKVEPEPQTRATARVPVVPPADDAGRSAATAPTRIPAAPEGAAGQTAAQATVQAAAKTAVQVPAVAAPPTVLTALSGFLSTKYEKLSYLISMHGIPIGSAELECRNEDGVTAITLRVKSNAAISSVFPVNDEVETRHIDGRFITTRIRQQEGSFKSDESFTINLGKKRVSWVDFSSPRSSTLSVPTDEVLDTLSGIYYLRNRTLQVGRTENLHIYDSETYAEVPVEILRREETRLPNLTKVAALVVRPLQKTAGIFRRTGEMLIWMTDDSFKVPIRIVTSVALGQVTAELINAETKPHAQDNQDPRAHSGLPVTDISMADLRTSANR